MLYDMKVLRILVRLYQQNLDVPDYINITQVRRCFNPTVAVFDAHQAL